MIKALLLIFDPANTWDKIEQAERNLARVFVGFLLPLLLISGAAEAYGLITFGHKRGTVVERVVTVSPDLAIRYKMVQMSLDLFVVFFGAWVLRKIGAGFHRRHSYTECFMALAYSLGPLFLIRILNAAPAVNPWIWWGVGIFLSVSALYRGIPRILKPDPSNALGLYILSSLLLVLITGLSQFLSLLVLDEKVWPGGW